VAEIPACPNSINNGGCWKSDPKIQKETDDAWAFRCATCTCLYVVSKDGVRDKSKFDLAVRRKKELEEEYARRMKRSKIFAV
jgi:hypothetical protein